MLTDLQNEQNLLRNTFAVQSDTLNSYLKDGAILLESVVDESSLSKLRTSIDHSLELVDSYFHRQRVWEHDETCREFCLDSVAPAIAATFLQSSKINLLYDQVFAKVAGDPATPWHNDLPYWPVRNGKALTVWLTVDPIKFDAGPLEFIAGSHLWDKWFQPFTVVKDGSQADYYEGTDGKFDPLPDFESERDKHKILCWEMEPGDVLVFDGMTVHGAKANTSLAMRRGYAIRYTEEGATYHTAGEINQLINNPELKDGQLLDSAQYPPIHFRN